MAVATGGPLLLGLIADIQYADKEDGTDYSGEQRRYFRNALRITENAIECFNTFGAEAIVQLGDVIDGVNASLQASETALRSVLEVLNRSTAERRFDLIGNHELYNIKRKDLATSGLNCLGPDGRSYYVARLGPRWEGIFLDAYEQSVIGLDEDDPARDDPQRMLEARNPNVAAGSTDWFKDLPVTQHRYVPYNGGVSPSQLNWLETTLATVEAEGRSALIFSHVPLHEKATAPKTVIWNCEEVLQVLHRHREAVVAVFAGHDHDGGYSVDDAGVHHVTMNSPLTATPGTECFALLECHDGGWARFLPHGRACVESGTKGAGRAYAELVLAKGAVNRPSEGAQSTSADAASGVDADAAAAIAAAAAAAAEVAAQAADSEKLVAMGFTPEEARRALDAAGGDVAAATELLCN